MLEEICREIAPFDKFDLLAKIAALQLMPENADRAIRLDAIAHAVASQTPAANQPEISSSHLRRLCNSRTVAEGLIGHAEDPCDNMFTEAFTFEGGSYVVFPGILEEPTFILRNLAKALFLTREPFPSKEFQQRARALFTSVLTLGDTIASRAGIARGIEPVSRPGADVVVLPTKELQRLKTAVTFQKGDLEQVLRKRGLSLNALEPLIVSAGVIPNTDYNVSSGPLDSQPIVRVGENIVVAEPGMLLVALRHHVVKIAIEYGFVEELSRRYCLAVWDSVKEALGYLRLQPVELPVSPATQDGSFLDGLFVLDTDKALYVQLVTDDLRDYQPEQVFGMWSDKDMVPTLERRQRKIEDSLFSKTPAPNEALVLVLIQGLGRPAVFGFDDPIAPYKLLRLFLSAGDLETIALAEGGDPLLLLKYARAHYRVRQAINIITTGQLDEFQLYRSQDYSYYISDEKHPNLINIVPGFAGEIRRKVASQRDRHGVPSYNRGYVTEVACLHSREIPIYVPFSKLGDRATVLVDGLPVPVWVIGPDYGDGDQRRLHPIYAEITDMIAYWLWQCAPWLAGLLASLSAHNRPLLVELHLLPSEDWFRIDDEVVDIATEGDSSLIEVMTEPTEYKIMLNLSPSVLRSFIGVNNAGERAFMRTIFQALYQMLYELGATANAQLDDNLIVRIIDQYIPLGTKKKLLVLSSHQDPLLGPPGLPPFRRIKHADDNSLLDDVGEYLVSCGWKVGPIADSQRTSFLNVYVVDYLYKRLEKLVSTLRPDELLTWLVGSHEAITRELFFTRLTIPTRLACFSDYGDLVNNLSNELPEIHKAALALRFLIEYVTARPPKGLRPMSLDVYDQLQAIASQIVNWAFESDMIYYGIMDMKLSILPSCRVGVDRQEYLRARSSYLSEYTKGEIGRAGSVFARHWRKLRAAGVEEVDKGPDQNGLNSEIDEVDEAFQAEFGFSLAEFAILFGDIYKIGEEQQNPVKMLAMEDMIDRLAASTGWTNERIAEALKLLSLEPRADFFSPAPPFNKVDVYPWRFNRSLSYIRRPLLKMNDRGRPKVVWGNRHIIHSLEYLFDLCFSGRLKAQSSKMRFLEGAFGKKRGDAFNDQVADEFQNVGGLEVRRRLKKIAGKRIQGPDGDFGDIDVLVVDQHHRIIRVIECKDLAIGRTPYELKRELDRLFRGVNGKRSIVEKHRLRTEWVRNNITRVLDEFSIQVRGRWKVEPFLIVDEEIFSPHLYPSPIPVVSFRQLKEDLLPCWFREKK